MSGRERLRFDMGLSPVPIERFLGKPIHVKCCGGYEVEGVLVGYDPSKHGGVGTLVLSRAERCEGCSAEKPLADSVFCLHCPYDELGKSWVLVRCWRMIYVE